MIGTYLTPGQLNIISERLAAAGLSDTKLEVHQQADQQRLDVSTLKRGLLSDLYTKSQHALEKKEQQIQTLQNSMRLQRNMQTQMKNIPNELNALFPQITEIWLSETINWLEKKV